VSPSFQDPANATPTVGDDELPDRKLFGLLLASFGAKDQTAAPQLHVPRRPRRVGGSMAYHATTGSVARHDLGRFHYDLADARRAQLTTTRPPEACCLVAGQG